MTLKEYHEKGIIKELYNKGIVSVNHITYFRYNQVFEAYLSQGLNRNKAYELTSDECGCSVRTVIKAVKVVNT